MKGEKGAVHYATMSCNAGSCTIHDASQWQLVISFKNLLAISLVYVGIQLVIKALSLKMANFFKILMLAFLNGL